jgi:hypothetical protein
MNRHERRALLKPSGAWKPLKQASPVPKTDAEFESQITHACKVVPDIDPAEVRRAAELARYEPREMWINDKYVVTVFRLLDGPGGNMPVVQLSIRRQDRGIARDWRDFQQIKNQLVGADCEGIELYPAEDRLVDTATQWHIWCVPDPTFRFPFGYKSGRVVTGESGGGSVQRPLEDE